MELLLMPDIHSAKNRPDPIPTTRDQDPLRENTSSTNSAQAPDATITPVVGGSTK
jgi:hypothetical protein